VTELPDKHGLKLPLNLTKLDLNFSLAAAPDLPFLRAFTLENMKLQSPSLPEMLIFPQPLADFKAQKCLSQ
jgi:hypothetical protein